VKEEDNLKHGRGRKKKRDRGLGKEGKTTEGDKPDEDNEGQENKVSETVMTKNS
jgi:hypothetical protein